MAKKVKKRTTMKKATMFSAIISLVAFLYKMGLGIISMSIILMVASISTLIVFICKVIFIKNLTGTRERKRKAYLLMLVLAFSFGILFLLFAVLKVGGIDTASKNNFEGIIGYIFISFVVLMFILSIINLKGALEKTDIMVMGLKEMTFVSALADAVIIEEFLYKVIAQYQSIEFLTYLNSFFPLIVAALMLSVPIFMFVRYKRYEA